MEQNIIIILNENAQQHYQKQLRLDNTIKASKFFVHICSWRTDGGWVPQVGILGNLRLEIRPGV